MIEKILPEGRRCDIYLLRAPFGTRALAALLLIEGT